MKIDNIIGSGVITEVNVSDKIIKEPGKAKQLAIAWRHDDTLPPNEVAKLGPKPDEKAVAIEWSNMLERTLERTNYGDLSRDFKFAEWLTKLFITGAADWEDISGEGGDALGAWHALSQRGLLDQQHQDLNRFKTLKQLQISVVNNAKYQAELKRIKNAAEIAKMKKDKKDIVIIDDDRFWVAIPLNYGACYVFNNTGHISNFCTGGSSGMRWFNNYAPGGPMYMIVDKNNIDTEDGKWQMHAQTSQLVNSVQDYRHDQGAHFGKLFPGLMRKIIAAATAQAEEIKQQSTEVSNTGNGYNVASDIALIKSKFPKSLTKAEGAETPDEPSVLDKLADKWYREFLDPAFTMDFDPDTEFESQTFTIRRNDGRGFRGQATSFDDFMNKVRNTRSGEWLIPGSIVSAILS